MGRACGVCRVSLVLCSIWRRLIIHVACLQHGARALAWCTAYRYPPSQMPCVDLCCICTVYCVCCVYRVYCALPAPCVAIPRLPPPTGCSCCTYPSTGRPSSLIYRLSSRITTSGAACLATGPHGPPRSLTGAHGPPRHAAPRPYHEGRCGKANAEEVRTHCPLRYVQAPATPL